MMVPVIAALTLLVAMASTLPEIPAVRIIVTSCMSYMRAQSRTRFPSGSHRFFIALVLMTWIAPLYAGTGTQVASKALPAVVLLTMSDAKGRPISLGSGFFIKRNVVVTNLHVIHGASQATAKLVNKEDVFQVQGVLAVDSKQDLALVQVQGTVASPISVNESKEPAVGDDIYALGNPEGLEGTVSQGIVSGLRKQGANRLIQISAAISPGSSGGPVLSADGQLIGVAVGFYTKGQNLNFCIPAGYVRDLVEKIGSITPLSQTGSAQGAGSSGPDVGDVIEVDHFSTENDGIFEFSIRNKADFPIRGIRLLFVFRDSQNEVVDYSDVFCPRPIPPTLAATCQGRMSDVARSAIAYWSLVTKFDLGKVPGGYEVRVLNFDVVH